MMSGQLATEFPNQTHPCHRPQNVRSHWISIAYDMLTAASSRESVRYKPNPSNSYENNDLVTRYDETALTLTMYITNGKCGGER